MRKETKLTSEEVYNEVHNQLTSLIRKRMEELKWNKHKLSREAGVSTTTITRLFRGNNVSLELIAKVASVLGCKITINFECIKGNTKLQK